MRWNTSAYFDLVKKRNPIREMFWYRFFSAETGLIWVPFRRIRRAKHQRCLPQPVSSFALMSVISMPERALAQIWLATECPTAAGCHLAFAFWTNSKLKTNGSTWCGCWCEFGHAEIDIELHPQPRPSILASQNWNRNQCRFGVLSPVVPIPDQYIFCDHRKWHSLHATRFAAAISLESVAYSQSFFGIPMPDIAPWKGKFLATYTNSSLAAYLFMLTNFKFAILKSFKLSH